eukprot:TRINITY_DN12551_c0_g1_i1.p1 TRINITY_DN12551_c0_g1~~TRINITY_DN12551_c0_g1_i1.p1  ORF type:complete len:339 (-),score=54.10 TRINITY_DN12551_c0_g1_i1:66-1058(-)
MHRTLVKILNSPLRKPASLESSFRPFSTIVPESLPISSVDFQSLADFVASRKDLVVISGAGLSTESGIPDYRSPNGAYSKGHKPINHMEFVSSPRTRQRYWARSLAGWEKMIQSRPNAGHEALARLERNGFVRQIITQNVDRLHQRAGSRRVVELHGHMEAVACLQCRSESPRADMQRALRGLNPDWVALAALAPGAEGGQASVRPDGDVEMVGVQYDLFRVPPCQHCGGVLKPTVVFFGDNVARSVVDFCMDAVHKSDGVLVVGSSLMVFSSFRFVRAASEKGISVAIVNVGPTRGDELAALKVEARCGDVLPRLHAALSGSASASYRD